MPSIGKRMYAYLVIKIVRGKVKSARKEREEVLPKANGGMTRYKTGQDTWVSSAGARDGGTH